MKDKPVINVPYLKRAGVGFIFAKLFLIITVLFSSCSSKNSVTIDSLLAEMTDRSLLSYFPESQFTHKQFSSYNRASVSPDSAGWFANADMSHFIRVEENDRRREFVLFDADGPGAVVRWWMTFYKAQNGVIRVYIDHDSVPVLQGTPKDMLRGNMVSNPPLVASVQEGAPLGEEGRDYDHNFYVPLPFSEHCKITYECDSLRLRYDYEGTKVPGGYYWPDVFYNIDYRAYSKKTKVESVTAETIKSAVSLFDKAGKELLDDNIISKSEEKSEKSVSPNDSLIVQIKQKNSAVSRLMVRVEADNMFQALRSVVIKASFDGTTTIWTPIGEFFGAGYTLYRHSTWMNKTDTTGIMESFWIMPFRENCTLAIINPFISQPTGIGNTSWGVTVNMRHRSLDAIPFKKSIRSDIELWHWADITMNYALTTYYYIQQPFETSIVPDIESVKHKVVLSKNDFTLNEK